MHKWRWWKKKNLIERQLFVPAPFLVQAELKNLFSWAGSNAFRRFYMLSAGYIFSLQITQTPLFQCCGQWSQLGPPLQLFFLPSDPVTLLSRSIIKSKLRCAYINETAFKFFPSKVFCPQSIRPIKLVTICGKWTRMSSINFELFQNIYENFQT